MPVARAARARTLQLLPIFSPSYLRITFSDMTSASTSQADRDELIAELQAEIKQLARKRRAVILAHNYERAEVQDVADFVGDSLGLSRQAAKTPADVIVFCGVHFMAETAKILNPNKIVILPDKDAGGSLEESCPADQLAALQKTNPNFWTIDRKSV